MSCAITFDSRTRIRFSHKHALACLGVLFRLDGLVDWDSIKSFPLARYAAQYWVTHARVENVSSRIKDGMECLFDADKRYFATWLWIYNEDRWGLSMSTMYPETPEAVPLYHAARLGLRDLAEHLITEHPEHVDARGGVEETPMHVAADAGHADVISLLFEYGDDIRDRSTKTGWTPLHRAAERGRLEVGQCLLDHGADINAEDQHRDTPLMLAVFQGHVEFARMLLERRAVIDAQNNSGETALHIAALAGHTQVVRLLLEHGADVNVCDNEDQTASQVTALIEIVELLSEYGGKSV